MKTLQKKFHVSVISLAVCCGFIFGVLASRIAGFIIPRNLAMAIIVAAFLFLSFCFKNFTRIICATLAGLLLGAWRMATITLDQKILAQYFGRDMIISGTLLSDAEFKDGSLRLQITDLNLGGAIKIKNCQIYIMFSGDGNFERSDRITLRGKLQQGFGDYAGFV